MTVVDASRTVTANLALTLAALHLAEADRAAAALAIRYAAEIDAAVATGDPKIRAWATRVLAPLLLDALSELGATPAARARLAKGGKQADAPPGQLDRLRQARAARPR